MPEVAFFIALAWLVGFLTGRYIFPRRPRLREAVDLVWDHYCPAADAKSANAPYKTEPKGA